MKPENYVHMSNHLNENRSFFQIWMFFFKSGSFLKITEIFYLKRIFRIYKIYMNLRTIFLLHTLEA